ncbi:hypothetical protein [Natrononativus amylolyticus]|uniref:hypothetical protein n=1 Tax=Natrononativus amylolyticus TaxID=2963434 RepID=UPI0020CD1C35|nr:hypothetical protein [Natrononativus amylolyticus]
MSVSIRRVLAGPATLLTYALLVVPFVAGAFKTALMTPLALPGYLIFVIGTAVGNALAQRFAFWVYWVPFFAGCYAIAVVVGYGYEWWRAAGPEPANPADGDRANAGR